MWGLWRTATRCNAVGVLRCMNAKKLADSVSVQLIALANTHSQSRLHLGDSPTPECASRATQAAWLRAPASSCCWRCWRQQQSQHASTQTAASSPSVCGTTSCRCALIGSCCGACRRCCARSSAAPPAAAHASQHKAVMAWEFQCQPHRHMVRCGLAAAATASTAQHNASGRTRRSAGA